MKLYFFLFSMLVSSSTGIFSIPEEPFQYRYEIVSNSRNQEDVIHLYYYKEKIIDTYETYFMPLELEKRETAIRNHIDIFSFEEDARSYYIGGTIVVLLGKARGLELHGELRKSECDSTVIREKIFIFDIFA